MIAAEEKHPDSTLGQISRQHTHGGCDEQKCAYDAENDQKSWIPAWTIQYLMILTSIGMM
jgi:hypothetical protein